MAHAGYGKRWFETLKAAVEVIPNPLDGEPVPVIHSGLLQRCTWNAAHGIMPFSMGGEARSNVGYGRETGEIMLSSRFTAHDPKRK
jgi:hypothetical protein